MPRFYTGIGARRTPPEVLALMTRAAFALLKRGYVLRSGHAIGADSAFERGRGFMQQLIDGRRHMLRPDGAEVGQRVELQQRVGIHFIAA